MQKLMNSFSRNPLAVFAAILIISALFGMHIPKLVIDPSAEGFMVQGDPEKVYYEKTIKTFGSDNMVIAYIQAKDVFSEKKINIVLKVLENLENIKYIEKVDSLFNQKNIKFREGGLVTDNFIDRDYLPESKEEFDTVKSDAITNPLVVKNLISKDGDVIALNITVAKNPDIQNYDTIVTEMIEKAMKPLDGHFEKYFQIGAPYFKDSLVKYIIGDQMTLVPIAVLLLVMVLILSLKSFNSAILPLATSGISVLWTFGFMALIGIPINIITVIVPSLLIVIGATEDIHMLSEYLEGLEEKPDKNFAIEFMTGKIGLAVTLTAFTTVAGFSSIILNDIIVLKQFGIVTTFALVSNFFITISFVPAYLKVLGGTKPPKKHEHKKTIFDIIVDFCLHLVQGNKYLVLGFLFILAVGIGLGATQIKVNNDTLSYFKKTSDIRKRSDIITEHMSGVQNFYITAEKDQKKAFKDPKNLKALFQLENHIRSLGMFEKVTGLSDFIALVNREMHEGDEKHYSVPNSKGLISQYLLMFHRKDVESYITSDFEKANIVVKHSMSSSHDLKSAVGLIKEYIDKNMPGDIKFRFTGENLLVNQAADTIALGQVYSLSLILAVIFVIMSVLFLNYKAGILSMIPNLFPIFIILGVMGYLKIDLNVGTAMIAAISIGIAVDDTIHLMVRYNSEMKKQNDQDKAIVTCMHAEGRPVLSTTTALALGFAILVLSNFTPVVNFGWLSAVVMILAVIADLIITPVLLSNTRLITIWDMIGLDLKDSVFKSEIFDGMNKWSVKKLILTAHMKEIENGKNIITQGEKDRCFYLLLKGEASVEVENKESGKNTHIKDMQPGNIFGEIALLGKHERTAHVIATSDCTLLEFDWESLQKIGRYLPMISSRFFLNLSRIISDRLADTTSQLTKERSDV